MISAKRYPLGSQVSIEHDSCANTSSPAPYCSSANQSPPVISTSAESISYSGQEELGFIRLIIGYLKKNILRAHNNTAKSWWNWQTKSCIWFQQCSLFLKCLKLDLCNSSYNNSNLSIRFQDAFFLLLLSTPSALQHWQYTSKGQNSYL